MIVHGLFGLTTVNTDESTPLDVLVVVALFLQAVGLMGFHTLQKENYGRIGRAGFYTFIVGALAHGLGLVFLLAGSETLAELLIVVGGLGILVGAILYGAATLQARVLPRWCGVTFVVFLPVTILLGDYGPIWWGLVWLVLGYVLWSRRGTATERPARVS